MVQWGMNMQFADEAVKQAALDALGEDGIESEAQLDAIDSLCVMGARSLADLPRFAGLARLELRGCALEGALPLRSMTGLSQLELYDVTGVTAQDIAPLTGLEWLTVKRCGRWDIAPLSGLTRLEWLDLSDMGIADVEPLRGMVRLRQLYLDGNPIGDIAPLRGLKRLEWLTVDLHSLKDRRILTGKPFATAIADCLDFPENAPAGARSKPRGRQRLDWLADVHPRLPFCRDAALFRLSGGQERLVCRDYSGKSKGQFDLYLDDKPLAEVYIDHTCEFSCRFKGGYGDGLSGEQPCLAVRERIDGGFANLRRATEYLAPFIGLMESGLYVVADCEVFPVRNDCGDRECFWNAPDYSEELHFVHAFVGGGTQRMDTPLFLAPCRRAADIDVSRVEHYRARLGEGERFPRAIALYLNGGVTLLLDGHHKAMACAMQGERVRTLVIFPLDDGGAAERAAAGGARLYLQRPADGGYPIAVCDGQGGELCRVSCLEHMKQTRVYAEPLKAPDWGRVPDECCTERFRDYPEAFALAKGCRMNQQDVRRLLEEQMKQPRGQHDMDAIARLRAYAALFPDSKWLTDAERGWLFRPDGRFMEPEWDWDEEKM